MPCFLKWVRLLLDDTVLVDAAAVPEDPVRAEQDRLEELRQIVADPEFPVIDLTKAAQLQVRFRGGAVSRRTRMLQRRIPGPDQAGSRLEDQFSHFAINIVYEECSLRDNRLRFVNSLTTLRLLL
ncbi:uncharacterized protein LOC105185340 [Harpegnathos saltator]|uniref:uncharacterized protein LOC105185340 n=1 Tax=Harpegnathos saltator TaxID=610380 RepID=UPI000DBEDE4A|nr:uncharacterized protein LOC105185340 [Harpegnathos saltator]